MRQLARRVLSQTLPRFLAVGCAGLATDAGTFILLSHLAPDAVTRALSLAIATLVTWQLNRRFTFAITGRRNLHEVARYALVAVGAQGFNYGLFLTLRWLVPGWPALAAILVSAAAAAGFSFAGQRLFTFAGLASVKPPSGVTR